MNVNTLIDRLTCPLCGDATAPRGFENASRKYLYACPACGEFDSTFQADDLIRNDPALADLRWCLSAATRREFENGGRVTLKSDNLREHINAFVGLSLGTKRTNLLGILREKSEFFGNAVEFSYQADWPLIPAKHTEECVSLLNHLEERGLLRKDMGSRTWRLTGEGWDATEPVAGGVPGHAFVAMAFHASLTPAFELGIQPAIEADCGMTATRTDKQHFGEKICDRIIAEIRRAQFVVADFTLQSHGVYFEAGHALALGRPVIWSCSEDDRTNLHFDIRQYPFIFWSEPKNLREQLRDRIRALILGARLG